MESGTYTRARTLAMGSGTERRRRILCWQWDPEHTNREERDQEHIAEGT